MKCLYPRVFEQTLFKNIDYLTDKFKCNAAFAVPCGKCLACSSNYRRDWVARMILESQAHSDAVFVTLTYSDDNLPDRGSLVKRDLQLFFKRLRRRLERLGRDKVRYFACGEYGDNTNRPHYHAIVWNLSIEDRELIEKSWELGFVRVDTTTNARLAYVAGYVTKKRILKEEYKKKLIHPPFVTMSRNRGLGFDTLIRRAKEFRSRGYIVSKGTKYPLTRYMKSIIYTVNELQKKVIDHVTENFKEYRKIFEQWHNARGYPGNSRYHCDLRYDISDDENIFGRKHMRESEFKEKAWYNNLRFYWKKRDL